MTQVRAVLLGRVSTDDKDQDPENQLGPLRDQAQRAGWVIVKELPIAGESAWDDKAAKKLWAECLSYIQRGGANLLAVWSWDRISRRGPDDAFPKIAELEGHYHAQFFSLTEPFLCTGTDPMQRKLLLSIVSWVAEWESKHRSDRLKAGYSRRRSAAENVGQRTTWGRGKVASDADKARVAQMHEAGATVRAIAAELGIGKSQVGAIVKSIRNLTDTRGPRSDDPPESGGGTDTANWEL